MAVAQIREIAAAQRLENVRYAIRDLALVADEVTREGHTVLSLNVGDPNIFDFQTPAHLIEAVYRAMRDNKNGYAPSPGITEALDAIRAEAARKSISSVQDVFVTTGISETVDICLTALINPGENILTPSPDYPLYSAVLSKLGIPITTYDLNEYDEWQPDLVDIQRKITSSTRAIVLINPNNPTGSVCSRRMLGQLADFARGRCTGYSGCNFWRVIKKLSRSRLAHRVGDCQRGSSRREAVHRRHSPPPALAAVCEPSGAVRDQARTGRPAGSFNGGSPQAAVPPRSYREVGELHFASQLCCAAWRVLRFPSARYPGN